MDKRALECLENKQGEYILPFLWLHGESKERIKEEILAIKNSGINEFCAESRPYEHFCQDEWWDDFGFILKTAKELDMRVWLLDDKKFPTGYANGYLEKEEKAHLRKCLVREYQIDLIGPMKKAKLFVGGNLYKDEKIIKVVAYRYRDNNESLDYETAVDLTSTINDGMAYWDIPEGNWRACIVIETKPYDYENDRLFYYIDMLNKDSCHAMIDAIYEPHYNHFKEYFGNTFLGFFSDEPAFLNKVDTYNNKLGTMFSPYPWRKDLPKLIAKSAGISEEKIELYIPALWEDLGEITSLIRMHYMEVVTNLYRENFSYQLGNWCREHNVMYIGHVIEDMGAHMRLAYGSGHYFRALDGQDMAGIDIVLMQDIPGISDNVHRSPLADGGKADPSFFRYTLPKLASSHSHIQPMKKGRAMCEIFGAFGWAEGLPFMKGLCDIMLSSGINYFVPHAFSPLEEDTDCPPHFYNGGKNIQYPLFKNLISYMKRCSHMISEGKHKADICVFYNAEGEWTGGKNQLFFELCRVLTRGLIDFDIIPIDYLENAEIKNNKLYVNGENYNALIISESEIMPKKCLNCFKELSKKGLDVIFTDSLPKKIAEGGDISSYNSHFNKVNTRDLIKYLRKKGYYHISADGKGIENLRFYHIEREEKSIYLFSNENPYSIVDVSLELSEKGECLIYEPWGNNYYKSNTINGKLSLKLEGSNMLFVIFGDEIPKDAQSLENEKERINLPLRFDISVVEEGESNEKIIAKNSECFDITNQACLPNFSGKIIYETSFEAKKGFDVVDLGQVGEVAEVWLNDKYLGLRINSPYKFNMKGIIKEGKNRLRVVVTNNLAHKRRDGLSRFLQIPPSGIIGDISLCRY